jgi:hypothetical protein
MKHFWTTLESNKQDPCTKEVATDMIQQYNTTWKHGTPGITSEIREKNLNAYAQVFVENSISQIHLDMI